MPFFKARRSKQGVTFAFKKYSTLNGGVPVRRVGQDSDNSGGTIEAVPFIHHLRPPLGPHPALLSASQIISARHQNHLTGCVILPVCVCVLSCCSCRGCSQRLSFCSTLKAGRRWRGEVVLMTKHLQTFYHSFHHSASAPSV